MQLNSVPVRSYNKGNVGFNDPYIDINVRNEFNYVQIVSVRTNDIYINSGQLKYTKLGVDTYYDITKIPYDRDDLILMLNDMDHDIQY